MIFGKKKQPQKKPEIPTSPLKLEDVKKAVMASSRPEQAPLEMPATPPPETPFPAAGQPEKAFPTEPAHPAEQPTHQAEPFIHTKPAEPSTPPAEPPKTHEETEQEIHVPEKKPTPKEKPAPEKKEKPVHKEAPKRRTLPLPPAPAGMEPKPGDVVIDIPSRPVAKSVTGGVLVKADEPELLRALVDLVNKEETVQVISALDSKELSVTEISAITKLSDDDIKSVLHRFVCLDLVRGFWYKSPSGTHIRKYKFETMTGLLEFDLSLLKYTLPIDDLKAKSTRLVALITTEGKLPRSLLVKALPVMGDKQLDQVIRYTEKFKLPNIRSLVLEETKLTAEPKEKQAEAISPDKKPPEIQDLYDEIATIEHSLSEID